MSLDALRDLIPAYGKDISLNLSSLANETVLNDQQKWGCFLASAHAIGVAPVVKGHGVGKTMLDALVVRAREIGAESLILEVAVDNDVAIAMYRSRGFAQIGLRKRYYQPEDVDAFTMQLVLDPVVVPPHEDDLLDDVAEPTAASGDSV